MSDTSQGDGWWQASDGKWYAPHLHPDAQSSGASAPPGADGDAGTPEDAPAAQSASSPMHEVGHSPAAGGAEGAAFIPTIAGAASISAATEQAARAAAGAPTEQTTPVDAAATAQSPAVTPAGAEPDATAAVPAVDTAAVIPADVIPADATAVIPAAGLATVGVAGAAAADQPTMAGSGPPGQPPVVNGDKRPRRIPMWAVLSAVAALIVVALILLLVPSSKGQPTAQTSSTTATSRSVSSTTSSSTTTSTTPSTTTTTAKPVTTTTAARPVTTTTRVPVFPTVPTTTTTAAPPPPPPPPTTSPPSQFNGIVPNVIGMSPGAAQSTLSSHGYSSVGSCTPGAAGTDPYPGVVTGQYPSGGSSAGRGAVVNFTYSIGQSAADPHPCA